MKLLTVAALVLLLAVSAHAVSRRAEHKAHAKQHMTLREHLKASAKGDFYADGATQVCVSWGDTHFLTFGGQGGWDLWDPRPFLLARYDGNGDKKLAWQSQANQVNAAWGYYTIDNDFAIRCGLDLVVLKNNRDSNPPVVSINGNVHSMSNGQSIKLPSAPDSNYYIYRNDGASDWYTYQVNCNHGGNVNNYASGMQTWMSWFNPYNAGWYNQQSYPGWWIYGNAKVQVQDRYAWNLDGGACGWNKNRGHPRNYNWLMEIRDSLFGLTAQDFAREAKESGTKISDTEKLKRNEETCYLEIEKGTGVNLKSIDSWYKGDATDVKSAIESFAKGCAIDNYFGVSHDYTQMSNTVCGWVKDVRDAINDDIKVVTAKIRDCSKKPYTPPDTLSPLLRQRFLMLQFCNKNAPKEVEGMPTGEGFDPTCERLDQVKNEKENAVSEADKKKQEQADEAASKKKEQEQEQEAKKIDKIKLEEESKALAKGQEQVTKDNVRIKEEEQKRSYALQMKAAQPLDQDFGPKPGTEMIQRSKVMVISAKDLEQK